MGTKSHKQNFLTSIIRAGNAASVGQEADMKVHLKEARKHQDNHIKEFSQGKTNSEVKDEHARLNSYYAHVKDIFNGKDFGKNESLEKGFGANVPSTQAGPGRKEYNNTGSYPKQVVTKPGQDKRYAYKHFSDLTPDQQVAAKHKFAGTPDVEQHHYPIAEDGTVAHAARWKDPSPKESNINSPQTKKYTSSPADHAPQAVEPYVKPKLTPAPGEVLPHHKRESAVRISSEGHEHHGKLGITQAPSPYYPGKVHVQVKNNGGGFVSTFVEPHEAVPSKMKKSEEIGEVVALSKAVLEKLNKRG